MNVADTTDTTTINLQNDITVNGKTFPAGEKISVPKGQADDISRMDYEHEKLKKSYHEKHVNIHNSGTFAVGSGAN